MSEHTSAVSQAKALKILFITSQWPRADRPGRGAPFVERGVRALENAGVVVDVLDYAGGWSFTNYLRAYREMRRRLRYNQYDLIHAYFGQCGLVARAQLKLPVIITYAGSDVEGSPAYHGLNRYKHYVLIGIGRLLSLLADEVIVVSNNLGRKLPRRDSHLIPGSLDLSLFRPINQAEARAQLGLPQDRKLVLFAALHPENPRKRYPLAAKACEIARKTLNLELIVLSGKSPAEVPLYMSACDALLLTSTNEGSPNVVKEALACNLPVVATDVGDVRERIGKLEGCETCESDEPEAIAAALLRVLQQPERANLREAVLHLDEKLLVERVKALYQAVLAKKRSGRKFNLWSRFKTSTGTDI